MEPWAREWKWRCGEVSRFWVCFGGMPLSLLLIHSWINIRKSGHLNGKQLFLFEGVFQKSWKETGDRLAHIGSHSMCYHCLSLSNLPPVDQLNICVFFKWKAQHLCEWSRASSIQVPPPFSSPLVGCVNFSRLSLGAVPGSTSASCNSWFFKRCTDIYKISMTILCQAPLQSFSLWPWVYE